MAVNSKSRALSLSLALFATSFAADRASDPQRPTAGEFHFARMIYTDSAYNGRFRGGWWQQDWPEAEEHFLQNLVRLTRVDAGEPAVVRLTDDALFDQLSCGNRPRKVIDGDTRKRLVSRRPARREVQIVC